MFLSVVSWLSKIISNEEQQQTKSHPQHEIKDELMCLAPRTAIVHKTQNRTPHGNHHAEDHIDNTNCLSHNVN